MNKSAPFLFGPLSLDTSLVFYTRLNPEISNTEQLLQALYESLWLPGYFGFNWNALQDCLRDLSWIPQKRVILEHVCLPHVTESELLIYLEILRDSVLDWKDEDDHCLEVVFSAQDRNKVKALLGCKLERTSGASDL